MDFADRLFALANGLPISEEPAQHLASDAPSAFEKFHEQIVLDHYLGKRSQPADEIPAALFEKIFAPRDFRDDGRAITPIAGGDLHKRFTPTTTTTTSDDEVELVESFSHGDVVAVLKDGVVQRTFYRARE